VSAIGAPWPSRDRGRGRPGPPGTGRTAAGLTLAGLTGTLAAVSSVGLLSTSAWLISRAAQHPPVLYLMVAAAAVQAFGLGRAGLRYAERLAGHDAALRILARTRMAAYVRLERLAPAGLAAFRSGDLISRLVTDIDAQADRWLRVRLPYVAALTAGAGAVAVTALLLPGAGLVLAASLLAAAAGAPAVAAGVARAEREISPRRGELAAAALDLLRGSRELAVYAGADGGLAAVTRADHALARAEARCAYGRGAGAVVTTLAAGASVWGALALGVPAAGSAALAAVALAVVVLTPLAAHEVSGDLASAAQQLPRLRSAAARVSAVLARPDPVAEPAVPAPLPGPPYDIRITRLSARWEPDGPEVLRAADLHVPAGHRVAVVGPTGSGKTTLAMVLLRFLDPAAGAVTLGGSDITTLAGEAVRTIVGLCAQDAHIFDSTLAENLCLARPSASDADLRDSLRRARLLDWAGSLPRGLDTPVGEHGARLSGGQRQRLALARVLLADFPVVILDEPAEHLEEQAADALTRDLLSATAGRTVLLITHRPVNPADVDQVVRLRDGRLQADPVPRRLRANDPPAGDLGPQPRAGIAADDAR
jgi:thiol reductant ABC exporter CydC subunit